MTFSLVIFYVCGAMGKGEHWSGRPAAVKSKASGEKKEGTERERKPQSRELKVPKETVIS